MKRELKALSRIREINATYPRNEYIDQWKKQGKKVMGWLCSYFPEEILYAAEILPIRMTGYHTHHHLNDATVRLSTGICTFARSCLQLSLDKKNNYLDGFVGANCCDHTRRLIEVFEVHKFAAAFNDKVNPPLKINEESINLFKNELSELKARLEVFVGKTISGQALWDAIDEHNRTRKLVKSLYNLRKLAPPPISGSEVMEVLNASYCMPKKEFNKVLSDLLDELEGKTGGAEEGKTRLMIIGSPMTDPELMVAIEDLGGTIVMEEMCTGGRHYWDEVKTGPGIDPMYALASRYLSNFPCARMVPSTYRKEKIAEIIRDWNVQGVISANIRFCTLYTNDVPIIKDRLEQEGCPLLELDVEYNEGGKGQRRTRVQAFLEMIEKRGA